jgi:hypothetical protein
MEASRSRHTRQVLTHMTRTNDIEVGRRLDRFDIDLHLSPANEAGLFRKIVGQIVTNELRLPGLKRLFRFPQSVILVTTAADGPDRATVGEHEHLGADTLRSGALGGHDRHQGGGFAPLERSKQRGQDFLIHQ